MYREAEILNIVLTDYKTVFDSEDMFDVFRQFGNVTLYESTSPDEAAERIKNADIVICNKTIISAEVMKNACNLKYIGLFATGYNNIDIEYTKQNNITVCNAGSYSTNAVAQHTFALILNHFSKVSEYNNFVNDGGWKRSKVFSPFEYSTHEIYGKTIGIIGYGSIGKAVAKIADAFGMNILVSTRTPQTDTKVKFVSIDELYEKSDIVTVHCPLNEQSALMFNSESFAKFKKGAFFINTARGGVVDEQALKDALENKILSAAAIDTITYEPMREDCVLYGVKNLVITPHIAWASDETRQRLLGIVIDNISNFINGTPTNKIN